MKSLLLFLFVAPFFSLLYAQQHLPEPFIAGIDGDTLLITTGATYSFSVDTPEDSGLVQITPTVAQLLSAFRDAAVPYQISAANGTHKTSGTVAAGDRLIAPHPDGRSKQFIIKLIRKALNGTLTIVQKNRTVNTRTDLTFWYKAGQRSPDATVTVRLPEEVKATPENTSVNIIGRGEVLLKDLGQQSAGRTGTGYPYLRTGSVDITDNGQTLTFKHLDLRPDNGADLKITIQGVRFETAGNRQIQAAYTTSAPEVLTSSYSTSTLIITPLISDLERIPASGTYNEAGGLYTRTLLKWAPVAASGIETEQSLDSGKTWSSIKTTIDPSAGNARITGLQPDKQYHFRLRVKGGPHEGVSNSVSFYSGKTDAKQFGITGSDTEDATDKINQALKTIHQSGGGTLLFSKGIYNVRTLHLQSNVWLYLETGAVIKALKGGDAPESTWFSDKKYRSGLSPTDKGPYENPENWLTKQDVGHTFFKNAMFFGERLHNIKIIGNGRITGDGNLVTGDKVMNNPSDNRCDKMFSLKLCTAVEIGGIQRNEDLWYDSTADAPYYILKNKTKDFNTQNMLQIDRAGHFVLLATGTDSIDVHDTYFARLHTGNARDIYDFMSCNEVTVTNIYSKVSSDDIVKPGSDCSLGFTRPAKNYRVRNVIGDTNCNLFQIGSETADDITDICVDNIYVLGANKAGFSISTNDGGHIRNIHLNCGHTGVLHHRSKMLRTYTPFFISISNRGRVLGADVQRFRFTENGTTRDELLVTNVSMGKVEDIFLNGVDISEVYGGSSYGKEGRRWTPYNGTQRTASPIIAGYQLPDAKHVEGGLPFRLPDGRHTAYISNIRFNDITVLVKGGHPATDTVANPPELGVGQYNASNLKLQPSWGLWARHVKNLKMTNASFQSEKPDGRYPLYFDDVHQVLLQNIAIPSGTQQIFSFKNATAISLKKKEMAPAAPNRKDRKSNRNTGL
ncbi:endopygalactorunase [Niabella beijingensis]|uniref:endopygalactorunase n=1 Tax=Niabella beijingensis TaxID=2872700 RepID=UPI001CBDBCC3|nr:endopygalactorunase [Niabella beijingensis]MBZ4190608.1 endopygalactorunase [Niabella beijingensis]